MNKDLSLKANEHKVVFLMVGNDETGKKSIAKHWANKYIIEYEENRTFYKTINISYEDIIDDEKVSFPIEIRIMNGDEIETDLKINSAFFRGALGAFVVTSIDDFLSFQDGVKWKEKVDLMCCLPNRFPLPIFLLINKCDKIERVKRSPWLEKIQLENYVRENQFFNHFFISAESTGEINRESSLSNKSVDIESPLKEMTRTILQFKDIKDKIIAGSKLSSTNNLKISFTKTNTKETKLSTNSSSNNSNNSTIKSHQSNGNKRTDKSKNCYIL